MKIINHCRDALPNVATGQLLGLDSEGVLNVSNCFPFPEEVTDESESTEYQINMMRCCREVNIDHNAVGWYQSTYMGLFSSAEVIETQFSYQQNISQSIMIVHDPVRASHGNAVLKAYRLSEQFMELFKVKKFTLESIKQEMERFSNVFEELPLKIKNSTLNAALVKEIGPEMKRGKLGGVGALSELYLEKNMEMLNESFDALAQDQYRWNRYHQHCIRQQQAMNHHCQKRVSRLIELILV